MTALNVAPPLTTVHMPPPTFGSRPATPASDPDEAEFRARLAARAVGVAGPGAPKAGPSRAPPGKHRELKKNRPYKPSNGKEARVGQRVAVRFDEGWFMGRIAVSPPQPQEETLDLLAPR